MEIYISVAPGNLSYELVTVHIVDGSEGSPKSRVHIRVLLRDPALFVSKGYSVFNMTAVLSDLDSETLWEMKTV